MLFGPTAAIRVMFFLTASLFNFLKTNEKGDCILLIYFRLYIVNIFSGKSSFVCLYYNFLFEKLVFSYKTVTTN